MAWQVATGNHRTQQMTVLMSDKFLSNSTIKLKLGKKINITSITTYNMTESIVCRTERANPAQSIALFWKVWNSNISLFNQLL